MRRFFKTFYSVLLLLLLVAGEIWVVCFAARRAGTAALVCGVFGFLLSVILAPAVHELGHVLFGKVQGMRLKMTKFFCFRIFEREGKLHFSFASPFSPEETQTVPVRGGNMRRRAMVYTSGGLVLGAVYLLLLIAVALICGPSRPVAFLFWAGIPYAAYLLLLNAVPAVYANGKTDTAILIGLAKEEGSERTMVSAMEIYGGLAEGKSFAEIDEKYYFGLPQLAENEPMYAVILDLRYRRYLETGETQKAADCLNRLGALAEAGYLDAGQLAEVATEFEYMHVLNGDVEKARESEKICAEFYGKGEPSAAVWRVRAALGALEGNGTECELRKERAERALEREPLAGVRKFERVLLSRISGKAEA